MQNKYYKRNSKETIIIIPYNGEPRERPIAVKDMKVHEPWQLEQLLSKKRWDMYELAELEEW